jgi:hypothetical protein
MPFKRAALSTLRSHLTSAEICRQNGWLPGTFLSGERLPKESIDQPQHRIRITALGLREVLAVQIWPDGDDWGAELLWDLHTREWTAEEVER